MPAQQVASLFAAIGADLSGLNKGLKRAKQQIRDSSATFRGYGDVIDVMEQKGTRLGFALSAAGGAAVALATNFAMTASRSKELGLIMDQVGTNAGFSSDALHAAAQAVKDVGITSQTAYKTITELVWAEIELSDAVKLANAAQDAARIKGEDTSQALEGLLHGIRTYNPLVLRTYGYTLDLAAAFKKEAETLGISADELTAKQKQQITLNAVVKAGAAISGVYEATLATLVGSLRSSARDVMNLAEAYGQHLEPTLLLVVNTGRTIIKWLTDLPEPLQAIITYGGTAAGVITAMAGGLILVVPQIARTIDGFNAMVTVVRTLTGTTIGLNAALATTMSLLGPIIGALTILIGTVKGVEWWAKKQRKTMEDTSKSYAEYITKMEEWLEVQNAMGKGHKGAVEDMNRMMGTLILTREQWEQQRKTVEEVREAQGALNRTFAQSTDLIKNEADALKAATGLWRDYKAERTIAVPHKVYGTSAGRGPVGYQEGGIVTKPTLAMLGEAGPEAVVPLGKMGGLGEPMQVIFQLPPGLMADRTALRQLAREVAMMLEKRSRGGGRQTAFSGSFS